MAARKKNASKKTEPFAKRLLRRIAAYLGVLAGALIVWMAIEGGIVQLRSAELPLDDLPPSFDGTTVLYISDLHINALNSVSKVNALIDELMRLEPDLLLLGGDYTNFDVFTRIASGGSGAHAVETELRDLFFLNLAEYNPPLGKFAVAGEHDNLLERNADASLREAMALGGVTLLRDEAVRIYKGNEYVTLVGVNDWSTGIQDTRTPASHVSAEECVVLLCHNPEGVLPLNNQPAADGIWIDAALCGHTHGGGVRLFGAELFNPLGQEKRFSVGWHMENSAKVLISGGVGNDLLPLRLNCESQVHLITLKTK